MRTTMRIAATKMDEKNCLTMKKNSEQDFTSSWLFWRSFLLLYNFFFHSYSQFTISSTLLPYKVFSLIYLIERTTTMKAKMTMNMNFKWLFTSNIIYSPSRHHHVHPIPTNSIHKLLHISWLKFLYIIIFI